MTTCAKHPRYKAKRRPATDCKTCWDVWLKQHLAVLEKLNRRLKDSP